MAIGILFMVVSIIPLQFISVTILVSDLWIEDIRNANGQLINQIIHPKSMETVYPYRWIGLVMVLIGFAVLGIGAVIKNNV